MISITYDRIRQGSYTSEDDSHGSIRLHGYTRLFRGACRDRNAAAEPLSSGTVHRSLSMAVVLITLVVCIGFMIAGFTLFIDSDD